MRPEAAISPMLPAMFYGWWIVASVFIAQLFMVGFITYAFPLIIVSVREDFGATATEINMAMTASAMVGIFLPPLVGPLVDRWSARWLMVLGAITLASSLVFLSLTQGVIQFVLVFALFMATANTLLGPITGSALVSRWFTTSRGKALGFAATGTSLGGVILPFLATDWLSAWGWRTTLQALALLTAGCVLPMLLFVLRDHPAEKGLEPEGQGADPIGASAGEPTDSLLANRDILGSRSYWLMGICFGLLFMGYTALLGNLGLYVKGQGLDASVSRTLISLVAFFGFVGKIALGAASDSIGLRTGLWTSLGLAGVGIALFSVEPDYPALVVASSLLGLAAGGMLPVWGGMIAAAFGTENFGRAMGLISPLIALLVMPGFMIAGWSEDTTGSFSLGFQIFVGQIVFASVLLLGLDLDSDSSPGKDSD
jgi:MFS family permease